MVRDWQINIVLTILLFTIGTYASCPRRLNFVALRRARLILITM